VDEETQLVVASDGSSPAETGKPGSPALNDAERMAATIVAAIDVIASRMQLETPHPKTSRRVRSSRTVSPEFISSLIASVEALPQMQAIGIFDPEAARLVLQSRDALRIVAERVAMLLASVNYTIEAQWADVVSAGLGTFSIASILAEKPENAELAAHVETLRRHLGRTNKPKPKKPKRSRGGTGGAASGE